PFLRRLERPHRAGRLRSCRNREAMTRTWPASRPKVFSPLPLAMPERKRNLRARLIQASSSDREPLSFTLLNGMSSNQGGDHAVEAPRESRRSPIRNIGIAADPAPEIPPPIPVFLSAFPFPCALAPSAAWRKSLRVPPAPGWRAPASP